MAMMSMASWSEADLKAPWRKGAAVYRCCEGPQAGSGPPARATTTPTAAAHRSVGTTPRRSASSSSAAPARTAYCHGSASARASGIAEPRIAPIAAGPAPLRKARALRSRAHAVEALSSEQDERERGREGDGCGEQSPADAGRRVADDRHRLDDRSGRDLAQRDGVEELAARHPVVVAHRIGLHERDDHEAAAVGQRPDLEGDPAERQQPAAADHERRERRRGRECGCRGAGAREPLRAELDRAAGQQDEHQPRAERRRGPVPAAR